MNARISSELPTVSIITPSFNQGEFIERTLRSVVSQAGVGSEFELEYIIVDGVSDDSSVSIIKKYADQYPCIQWVSEHDKGQSDAINKGLRQASGDICGWLNSDDELSPSALQQVIQLSNANPKANWFIGNCIMIDNDGRECFKWITAYKKFWLRNYSFNRLLIEDFISQPSTFWRREFLSDVGLLDINDHTAMDYDLWLRMGKKSDPAITLATLARHRRYKESKTGSRYIEQARQSFLAAKRHTSNRSILLQNRMNAAARIFLYKAVDLLFW